MSLSEPFQLEKADRSLVIAALFVKSWCVNHVFGDESSTKNRARELDLDMLMFED